MHTCTFILAILIVINTDYFLSAILSHGKKSTFYTLMKILMLHFFWCIVISELVHLEIKHAFFFYFITEKTVFV